MKDNSYTVLARVYDKLNGQIDYPAWADFIEKIFEKHKKSPVSLVLDLACGTGSMTLELARRGYDMTAVDLSPDMLSVASERAIENQLDGILFLCQNMRKFELYGTVDAVVCCLDSVNYLRKKAYMEECFACVHNYLNPDGIFIFDVNTPYKFENVYGNNDYIIEEDGVYCGWQNYYDMKTHLCDFRLDIFFKEENGLYSRAFEEQTERMFTKKQILSALEKNNFELLEFVGGYNFEIPDETCERWYIAARAIKDNCISQK